MLLSPIEALLTALSFRPRHGAATHIPPTPTQPFPALGDMAAGGRGGKRLTGCATTLGGASRGLDNSPEDGFLAAMGGCAEKFKGRSKARNDDRDNVWPGRALQEGVPRPTNVRAASMY